MEFFKKIRRKNKNISFHEVLQELRWLYKYITRYRATIIVHIFLGILAIFMGFASSIASKYLIDAVTGYKSEVIALAASVMLIMILGNIVMKSVAARIGAILNIRVQNEIQAEIYEHVIAADWESLESFRSGDLLNRLTGDVNTVAGGVTSFIPNLISKSVQFLGALAIILYYDSHNGRYRFAKYSCFCIIF